MTYSIYSRHVAPSLATAVAGPSGGAAVTALASKFGASDSVDAVAKAIAGDTSCASQIFKNWNSDAQPR